MPAVTLAVRCLVYVTAAPAPIAAQATTEFTPLVGVFLPTTQIFEQRDVLVAGDKATLKHTSTVVFGGRLGGSVSERVAFEAVFGYAPSKAEVVYTDPSNVETRSDPSATIFLGSFRLRMGLGSSDANPSWHFTLGASVISHGGDAYDGLRITDGTTDVGATVGVGGRLKLGPSMAIRLDVEDYLYSATLRASSGAESPSKFQNDIVISLGLAIPFGTK